MAYVIAQRYMVVPLHISSLFKSDNIVDIIVGVIIVLCLVAFAACCVVFVYWAIRVAAWRIRQWHYRRRTK